MPQGKRDTKNNAKRQNLTPAKQNTNGPKKLTRTSTGMVAKAPAGSVVPRRIHRARFG